MSDFHPEHDTLYFLQTPVRVSMVAGVPWFSLTDLCETKNFLPDNARNVDHPDFPAFAKRTCLETGDDGEVQEGVLLSPTGVWYFTEMTSAYSGQHLAGWARKESKRLCPRPTPGDPAMFLTLLPGNKLPPRPLRYTGRVGEWEDLRYSNTYVRSKGNSVVNHLREARAAAATASTAPSAPATVTV